MAVPTKVIGAKGTNVIYLCLPLNHLPSLQLLLRIQPPLPLDPPPVLPLQPTKKVQIQAQEKATKASAGSGGGGVAVAAAALEKLKENRVSTMTEIQILEKLKQVVSENDPKLLYSKIKKVGQG